MRDTFFNDLPTKFADQALQKALIQASNPLDNLSTLSVGGGDTGMYVDQTGLNLGGTPGNAPFSVDMNGNANVQSLTAPNITVAAANITGTIQASQINTSQLVVGTNVGLGTAQNAAGVTTIIGNTVTTGYVNALNITANYVVANISMTTPQLNSPSISGGSISGTTILINHQSGGGDPGNGAYLRWNTGSHMWEDNTGRLGIASPTGPDGIYLYVENQTVAVLNYNAQANFLFGVHCTNGSNLNVDGNVQINGQIVTNNENMVFGGSSGRIFTVRNAGVTFSVDGSNQWHIDAGNGSHVAYQTGSSGTWFLNGNTKSAIVPTLKGYNALYCIESPDVWFVDFCESMDSIDPMFLEVTEGPIHFIDCENGGYQVWRRRKGHPERFETKTYEEFLANEKYLAMAKPN